MCVLQNAELYVIFVSLDNTGESLKKIGPRTQNEYDTL